MSPLLFTLLASATTEAPRVAHVFVALADNDAQGIVKVPANLGNGQKPRTNLYWGARYGVATFLEKDAGWKRIARIPNPKEHVLERLVFRKKNFYLVADAYDGRAIKKAIETFTRAAAGHDPELIEGLRAGGDSELLAYVGHDGLMEFDIDPVPPPANANKRSAIVLACVSKSYFLEHLQRARAEPLLLTTSLMAPEAYTLDAAITAHFEGASAIETRNRAAAAYCKYQKCSETAGRAMFTTMSSAGS